MSSSLNTIGRLSGYGACERCGDTWNWKAHHTTDYDEGAGCFPLCEECWAILEPVDRLPFYRALFRVWKFQDPKYANDALWQKIESAVLQEGAKAAA